MIKIASMIIINNILGNKITKEKFFLKKDTLY